MLSQDNDTLKQELDKHILGVGMTKMKRKEGGAQMMHTTSLLNGVGLQKHSWPLLMGLGPCVIFHCLQLTVMAV